jgi:hypothetical protein
MTRRSQVLASFAGAVLVCSMTNTAVLAWIWLRLAPLFDIGLIN